MSPFRNVSALLLGVLALGACDATLPTPRGEAPVEAGDYVQIPELGGASLRVHQVIKSEGPPPSSHARLAGADGGVVWLMLEKPAEEGAAPRSAHKASMVDLECTDYYLVWQYPDGSIDWPPRYLYTICTGGEDSGGGGGGSTGGGASSDNGDDYDATDFDGYASLSVQMTDVWPGTPDTPATVTLDVNYGAGTRYAGAGSPTYTVAVSGQLKRNGAAFAEIPTVTQSGRAATWSNPPSPLELVEDGVFEHQLSSDHTWSVGAINRRSGSFTRSATHSTALTNCNGC